MKNISKIMPKIISNKPQKYNISEIILNYKPDGKPLTKNQEFAVITFLNNRNKAIAKNLFSFYINKSNPLTDSQTKILAKFKKYLEEKNINKKIIKNISSIKTEGDLNNFIIKFDKIIKKYEINPLFNTILKIKKGKNYTLEQEQIFYKKNCIVEDCIRTLFASFTKPSTNPDVIKIENILKKDFGVESVLLNNDNIRANKILSSVKKLKENNIPIPNEYIVTDLHKECSHLTTHDGQKSTVLLSSTKNAELTKLIKNQFPKDLIYQKIRTICNEWKKQCGFKNLNSTTVVEHTETHEAIHGTHPFLLSFLNKNIEKYKKIIKKISGYCALKSDNPFEIYTELKTKSLYQTLEQEEEKLLEYLWR